MKDIAGANETPEASGANGAPATPEASKAPEVPQVPKAPKAPKAPEAPRKWYVIQVRTSSEEGMCRQIERACEVHDSAARTDADRVGLKECFNPRFQTQRKWKGEWQTVEHSLLPGYVLAEARNPAHLAAAIRTIYGFCRLLSNGEAYTSLDDGERVWLERYTNRGDRVVPMSFGRRVGDRIEVTEGALKGYEGTIQKIDRRNSLACIEFHVGPMTIKTKVGLGIIPSKRGRKG